RHRGTSPFPYTTLFRSATEERRRPSTSEADVESQEAEEARADALPGAAVRGADEGALERLDCLAAETFLQIQLGQAAEGGEVRGPQLHGLFVGAHGAEGLAGLAQRAAQGEVVPRRKRVCLRRL